MAFTINRVVFGGNLTRDPELRQTPGGQTVCAFGLAVNQRVRDRDSGQWADKPMFFNVSVFGRQAETCQQYLTKGRPVVVDGRLSQREWQTQEGEKRLALDVIADNVQFGSAREGAPAGAPRSGGPFPNDAGLEPADEDFGDDIPF
jgi:single-strand DNA-binding protein